VANPRRQLERLVAVNETVAAVEAAVLMAKSCVARPRVECLDRRTLATLLPPEAVHQGFAALAMPLPALRLGALCELSDAEARLLLVILDRVTDPRNVGSVLRSAHAFGAAAVVMQDRHAPQESGTLAKAASGALESIPLIRVTNLARTLEELREHGVRCVGLAGDAVEALEGHTSRGATALVLGAEGEGLRHLVRQACDVLVRIPIAPRADSLNLAAAAAIALYECRRTRVAAQDDGDLTRKDLSRMRDR
jgi:23S rRNA (guanosine2251-2'-O)-methyltransferase